MHDRRGEEGSDQVQNGARHTRTAQKTNRIERETDNRDQAMP